MYDDLIDKIYARQIFDSRGMPTIEVDTITRSGILGRASVPSGASVGKYEALELRDNGKDFLGNGVSKAVYNVNKIIAPKLIGDSVFYQSEIDGKLINIDGSENKSNLGSNSLLGVSLSVARAAANQLNIPLYRYLGGVNTNVIPVPMMNIINGGIHSDSGISFQEFMIIPFNASSFFNGIKMAIEVFYNLKKILIKKKLNVSLGDEGGFAPKLNSSEEAIEFILEAIKISGYNAGKDIMLGLDCAASEFYSNGFYNYKIFEGENGKILSSKEQVEYLLKLVNKYPILSIEDGMDQNDLNGWKLLTVKIGDKVQLVGDDVFVTQFKRLNNGIKNNIANSILIKYNQVGTLTETIDTINLAKKNSYNTIISHRSGETEDNFISDLSVAFNTGQIKIGSISRSERTCKYNQLIRIEEFLNKRIKGISNYPGINAFNTI